MIPSVVPEELQGLTQIEEMLIAQALPIMKVYIKPGGQRRYSGHCIDMPQQVNELANTLPRYPKNIPLILITMKDVIVRKAKVERALLWLIKHNPLYQDITIDKNSQNQLPTEGVPVNLQTINTQSNDYTINDTDTDNDTDDSEVVYNNRTETSSFLPHCNNDKLETNAIYRELHCPRMNWPSIKNEPLNEYITPFLGTMAFPTLCPDGKGDPTNLLHRETLVFLMEYSI